MNPSLDTTSRIDRVERNVKLRTRDSRHDPGGGSLNVSRAMKALGSRSRAVWAKGGAFGAHVAGLLDDLEIDHIPVAMAGDNKQSFAVIEESTGDHYRFTEPGSSLTTSEEHALIEEVDRQLCRR